MPLISCYCFLSSEASTCQGFVFSVFPIFINLSTVLSVCLGLLTPVLCQTRTCILMKRNVARVACGFWGTREHDHIVILLTIIFF